MKIPPAASENNVNPSLGMFTASYITKFVNIKVEQCCSKQNYMWTAYTFIANELY
jgi:hypothetical protein